MNKNIDKRIDKVLGPDSSYKLIADIKDLIKRQMSEMVDAIEEQEFSDGNWTEDMHEWADKYIQEL
jgi:hypothetical protein